MIVIHPGMVKSATTSLQELVFARHPEITLLGLPAANPEAKEAIRQICRADSIFYDHETVEAALKPLAAAAGDGTAVLAAAMVAIPASLSSCGRRFCSVPNMRSDRPRASGE